MMCNNISNIMMCNNINNLDYVSKNRYTYCFPDPMLKSNIAVFIIILILKSRGSTEKSAGPEPQEQQSCTKQSSTAETELSKISISSKLLPLSTPKNANPLLKIVLCGAQKV